MALTTVLLVAAIVLGCLQLALAITFGRRTISGRGVHVDAAHLERFARRLGLLVNRVADEVGQHQARIASVNRRLAEAGTDDAGSLAEMVLNALTQMVESDAQLQQRLAQAEEKLQQQAEQIQRQISEARTDSLTELPNRRAFRDELDRQIAQWQRKRIPFCLMMIDADHFKDLNDRYGHPAGDQVLRSLGEALRGTLREMDLVARVGGEEFAALLPSTNAGEAIRAAQRVRAAVEAKRFHVDQHELSVTVSLGLASAEANDNAVSLIKRADEALYASKRAGRNCGHYHDGQTCRRIDQEPNCADQSALACSTDQENSAPATVEVPPGPADDSELRLACQMLRARLAEMAKTLKANKGNASTPRTAV